MTVIFGFGRPKTAVDVFETAMEAYGPFSRLPGINREELLGCEWARCLLGPDHIKGRAHVVRNNVPTDRGTVWNSIRAFDQPQPQFNWKRGHLINGDWDGAGKWTNMTVLSAQANNFHRGLEAKVKNYLLDCAEYEAYDRFEQPYMRPRWYGVYYSVRCSQARWGQQGTWYHRIPMYIYVQARAIAVPKPNGGACTEAQMRDQIEGLTLESVIWPGDEEERMMEDDAIEIEHEVVPQWDPVDPQIAANANFPDAQETRQRRAANQQVYGDDPPIARAANGFDFDVILHQGVDVE